MGTKNNPGKYDCYEKAEPDEPMFVVLARDPTAPALVRMWVEINKAMHGDPSLDEKRMEALDCADAMERWREGLYERLTRQERSVENRPEEASGH